MTIRFNPDLYAGVLDGLNLNQRDQQQALQELSTGRRVNAPSDDPAAAGRSIGLQAGLDQLDQFNSNISTVTGKLQTADSTLSSVVSALNQAIGLGVQGGDGTLSAQDRTVLSNQIQTISDQVMSLANSTYQGSYIFAGSASGAPAFAASGASPSGVVYNGNTGVNQVEVSQGTTISTNVPGSQIFTSAGSDVFAALKGLAVAVQSGTGVSAAVTTMRAAFDHVTAQRSFYGSTLQQLDRVINFLAGDKVQLSQQQNDAVGIDLATAATDVQKAMTARSALLAAGAQIPKNSLLDYLPNG